MWLLDLNLPVFWDFPGGTVVKTLCLHSTPQGAMGLIPGWWTKILHAMRCSQKKKKKATCVLSCFVAWGMLLRSAAQVSPQVIGSRPTTYCFQNQMIYIAAYFLEISPQVFWKHFKLSDVSHTGCLYSSAGKKENLRWTPQTVLPFTPSCVLPAIRLRVLLIPLPRCLCFTPSLPSLLIPFSSSLSFCWNCEGVIPSWVPSVWFPLDGQLSF